MERIAVVDGLTVAAVLARIAGGVPVVLTYGGDDVAVMARPDDLNDAATAYLLEAFERSGPSLSALLADLEAAPHPVTLNGRPQSPPAGVS